jgi:hypothetical protein
MVVTLAAVAVGGMIGMWIPRWMGWDVNTMATSLSIAMCFGAMGFAMPRVFVGLGLMVVLSVWASWGTWMMCHESAKLVIPRGSETLRDFCAALWLGLPAGVKSALPMAVGMGALSALALVLMWKRLATVVFYSLMGVSMMLGMGLWVVTLRAKDWPQFLPQRTQMQMVLVAGMVVLGAMVQWVCMPMKRKLVVRQERREMAGAES